MTYTGNERRRATAWKSQTTALPDEAKAPAPYLGRTGRPGGAPYAFCLPAEHAPLNLLPEVGEAARALFAAERIPWHAGVGSGPSNYLLSSQVQYVNALGQVVQEKARGHGADSVRVLHVLPPGDSAYQDSLVRPEHRALGGGVSAIWQRLLSRPDRFVHVDPEVVLDPSITSQEYVSRYGTQQ